MSKISLFFQKLLDWYQKNRRSLPFRDVKDPYKVWVSEVLLQQTQMSRGVAYYSRFIERFPDIASLARASWEEFLPYFQGLGYYNRGRNMLKAAKILMEKYGGEFPKTYSDLRALPGVGEYTANAILSFAYGQPTIPLDTNIKRITGRVFLGVTKLDETGEAGKRLLKAIQEGYKKTSSAKVNQAMMDLASSTCVTTRPLCHFCPLQEICDFYKNAQPHLAVATKRLSKAAYEYRYPLAEIHWQDRLILYENGLPGGKLERGDARHFLQKMVKEKLHLTISVRPAYKAWLKDNIQYQLHRCYVLLGEEQIEKKALKNTDELEKLLEEYR